MAFCGDSGRTECRRIALGRRPRCVRCVAIHRVEEFRVRWPNDVLVENRKLAGLLIDQFVPELAVAGIGINVFNHPETHDSG